MKLWIAIALLGAGGYFAWKHDWPSQMLRRQGAALEARLNQTLSENGVHDRDITRQLRRERRHWYWIRWIQTSRDINLPKGQSAIGLVDELARIGREAGYDVEQEAVRGAVLLDMSRWGLRFQRLVLFTTAAKT